jgi:hypothetical protein
MPEHKISDTPFFVGGNFCTALGEYFHFCFCAAAGENFPALFRVRPEGRAFDISRSIRLSGLLKPSEAAWEHHVFATF